jgi:hypothetical protein
MAEIAQIWLFLASDRSRDKDPKVRKNESQKKSK